MYSTVITQCELYTDVTACTCTANTKHVFYKPSGLLLLVKRAIVKENNTACCIHSMCALLPLKCAH